MRELIVTTVKQALNRQIAQLSKDLVDRTVSDPAVAAAITRTAEQVAVDQIAQLQGEGAQSQGRYYTDLDSFVVGYLARIYARDVGALESEHCWCPQYWAHPEAESRLRQLWETWEDERLLPQGMQRWWLQADYHMSRLMDANGTFAHCTATRHQPPPRLACVPRPGLDEPEDEDLEVENREEQW
ncbi:DUF4913 domain-containing protein [Nocardia takedensis]|uniref:DUF4913 domain-containing protein n=1 Tax=Nocardia takedensis TaxID=259390 RepID=UPI003F76F6F3